MCVCRLSVCAPVPVGFCAAEGCGKGKGRAVNSSSGRPNPCTSKKFHERKRIAVRVTGKGWALGTGSLIEMRFRMAFLYYKSNWAAIPENLILHYLQYNTSTIFPRRPAANDSLSSDDSQQHPGDISNHPTFCFRFTNNIEQRNMSDRQQA